MQKLTFQVILPIFATFIQNHHVVLVAPVAHAVTAGKLPEFPLPELVKVVIGEPARRSLAAVVAAVVQLSVSILC